MPSMQILVFVVVLAATEGLVFDPCDPANHKSLNEPHRSTAYRVSHPGTPICDRYLETGWYRFTSKAGGLMPTQCPKRYQCGTVVPIWMQGSHPTVEDGIVVRKVCANFASTGGSRPHCCENSRRIRVLNCVSFFVYQLRPTPSCPMAYCAGGLAPCPQGKWSHTSFPPCRDAYPLMKTPPTLTGPHIRYKSFAFRCKFDFPQQDPDQRFQVTWTFEGQEDPNLAPQILSDPQREAILDGSALAGHINQNIRCQVRSYYESIGMRNSISPYLKSNAYYAGIKIHPTKLYMSQKDSVKDLTITSTLPILCDHDFKCYLVFTLGIDRTHVVSTATACDFYLEDKHWDPKTSQASINVSLVANQDIVDFGKKQAIVTFDKLLPAGGGSYQDVFFGHVPHAIHVDVKGEKTSHCYITGDPHIRGHEFGPYHLYLAGDFTVYQVKSLDFEIQIRTWPCGSLEITCVCGVSIREKNDIIRINQCDQPFGKYTTSPTIRTPHKLSDGTLVKRSKNSRNIAVYLPSGVELKIVCYSTILQLYITSPGSHEGLARGICGSNDGNTRNEFTHPDGKMDPICANPSRVQCLPNRFFESWRVPTHRSLFEKTPNRDGTSGNNNVFCQCHKERQKIATITCGARKNLNEKDNLCPGCPNIAPIVELGDGGWTKREAVFADEDVPDTPTVVKFEPMLNASKTWPNAHGVTENQARRMCSQALQSSQLWQQGEKIDNLTDAILSECMMDILFGDTTDFVKTVTDQLTAVSQIRMSTDANNYVTDQNGGTVMKAELLADVCSHECNEHGSCGAGGKCLCNEGWEGEDCQIDSKKGPQLIKIRSGSLCDNQKRPCKRIFIDATNIESTEHLRCKIQLVDEQENAFGKPITTQAILLTAGRISCELPGIDESSQDFKVSATSNGQVFGNELKIRVFDSRCLNCNSTACTQEPSACHIDKKCHDDQQVNPSDWRQTCDVMQNTGNWTNLPSLPFTPVLSGPTSDSFFICKFTPQNDVLRSFKVTWYLDSKEVRHQTLTRFKAYLRLSDLPTSGKLTCVIQTTSDGAFSESNAVDYVKN